MTSPLVVAVHTHTHTHTQSMHRRPHTHWKSSNIPSCERRLFFLSVSLFIQEKKQKVSERLNTHTYFTVNGVLIASRYENRQTTCNASREQGGIYLAGPHSRLHPVSVRRFTGESPGRGGDSGRRCSADTGWDNECAEQKWVDKGREPGKESRVDKNRAARGWKRCSIEIILHERSLFLIACPWGRQIASCLMLIVFPSPVSPSLSVRLYLTQRRRGVFFPSSIKHCWSQPD